MLFEPQCGRAAGRRITMERARPTALAARSRSAPGTLACRRRGGKENLPPAVSCYSAPADWPLGIIWASIPRHGDAMRSAADPCVQNRRPISAATPPSGGPFGATWRVPGLRRGDWERVLLASGPRNSPSSCRRLGLAHDVTNGPETVAGFSPRSRSHDSMKHSRCHLRAACLLAKAAT